VVGHPEVIDVPLLAATITKQVGREMFTIIAHLWAPADYNAAARSVRSLALRNKISVGHGPQLAVSRTQSCGRSWTSSTPTASTC